jgi:spore germination cell wall hydrolase CwlJ-like protein
MYQLGILCLIQQNLLLMQGELKDNTGGATYYYAHNLVYPAWADHKQQTQVIGDHTFLRRQAK